MQARALVPGTVSDDMRLLYGPVKELIVCIIFFVCFGAQSGCIAGWSPKNAGRPALPEHLLWGAFHVERGVGCFGVPAEQNFVGALLFEPLKPLVTHRASLRGRRKH